MKRLKRRRVLTIISCMALLVLAPLTLVSQAGATQGKMKLNQIQEAITQKKARWVAEDNEVSILPIEEQRQLLGFIPSGEEPMYGEFVIDGYSSTQALPEKFDWRNYNGKNYVTSVKQQRCSDCWAFAAVGSLEIRLAIDGSSSMNLSEQLLVSTCSSAGSCSGGYINMASQFLVDQGTPEEVCYPYRGQNSDCGEACSGWQNQAYRASSTTRVSQTVDAIKAAVYTRGPVNVGFMVYSDFSSYRSGVYERTGGVNEGGHAVIVVGYDDTQNCFIVKNSWGPSWGESGYFRIAYNQVSNEVGFGMDAHCYGDEIDHAPNPNPTPVPPDAPQLQAARAGDGKVTLVWENVANATGYKVHYGRYSGDYTETLNVGTATTHTVVGLINNERYYFTIVAYSNAGDSKESNELNAMPTDSNPNPVPNPTNNLIINPGFEEGSLAPWANHFCGNNLISQEQAHNGSFSLLQANRETYYCSVQQDLTGKLKNGVTYQFSAWMRLRNTSSDTAYMTLMIHDDNGYRYEYMNPATITNTGWTEVGGELKMELVGQVQELAVILYGPGAGVEFFLDDVTIKDTSTPVPSDPYKISVEQANQYIHANAYNDDFILLDVRTPEEFQHSHIADAINIDNYAADFEAQIDTLDPSKFYLVYCRTQNRSIKTAGVMESKGFSKFYYIHGGMVEWTEKGYPVVTPAPPIGPTDNLASNPGFEKGTTESWEAHFGGQIAVTRDQSRNGEYCLLGSYRDSDWSGAYQVITEPLKNGETYKLSAWVKLKNASQSIVRMLLKIEDDAGRHVVYMDPVMASDSQWTMIGGEHTANLTGQARLVAVHIYGPPQYVDFYLDDVMVEPAGSPNPNPNPNPGVPTITSIPRVTLAGSPISINGINFDTANSRVEIKGNGVDTWGTVLSRSASRITVENPNYANGRYQISVYNGSQPSNTVELVIDCGG
ncbi:C1 family peptidase [Desulfoluna spongiiphila]|uniref:C1 family peptidase n=1 Tax=Desulfoluna spongiiphila TaxID=419481 RepID=UPI0012535B70|nr:C1 family peptidase [Desulfoluna spongiiphila]VVS93811.1 fibronectin type iii [Desulfoluna spongiiphila]